MGDVIQASCSKCGFGRKVLVGGGLMDCEFDTIISGLSDEDKQTAIAAKAHGATAFSVTRKFSVCDHCKQFYAANEVEYRLDGKLAFLQGCCPYCGNKKRHAVSEKDGAKCPDCGGKIKTERIGIWD